MSCLSVSPYSSRSHRQRQATTAARADWWQPEYRAKSNRAARSTHHTPARVLLVRSAPGCWCEDTSPGSGHDRVYVSRRCFPRTGAELQWCPTPVMRQPEIHSLFALARTQSPPVTRTHMGTKLCPMPPIRGNDLEILTRTASIRDLGSPNDSGLSPGSGSRARDLPDP